MRQRDRDWGGGRAHTNEQTNKRPCALLLLCDDQRHLFNGRGEYIGYRNEQLHTVSTPEGKAHAMKRKSTVSYSMFDAEFHTRTRAHAHTMCVFAWKRVCLMCCVHVFMRVMVIL